MALIASRADLYFNPRSPCGERQKGYYTIRLIGYISIHAPRVGSDGDRGVHQPVCQKHFNPRSPCGERPMRAIPVKAHALISIHAPRVGSDAEMAGFRTVGQCISIHAPRVGSDQREWHE